MNSQIILYKKRGKSKPLIGVVPVYGASGRKIIDYKPLPFNGVESFVEPTLENLGIRSVLNTTQESHYSMLYRVRIGIFFVQCKNNICNTKSIVWVPITTLRLRSSISSDTLTRINTFVNNPTSYALGK